MPRNRQVGPANVGTTGVKTWNNARLRVDRLARVLSLTDRILSPKVTDVEIVDRGPAPAWTDGATITLNEAMLPSLTGTQNPLAIPTWLGANYHELGHVLYTPRNTSPLKVRVNDAAAKFSQMMPTAWNILEDQRQERLMIAQFKPLRAYYTVLSEELIVKGAADVLNIGSIHCLIVGRTWLPVAVRDAAKAAFIVDHGTEAADELDRVVSDYQRLSDPGFSQADEAYQLVVDFVAVLGGDSEVPQGTCHWSRAGNEGEDDAAETDAVPTPDEGPDGADGDEGGEGMPSDGDADGESDEDGAGGGDSADEGTDEGQGDPGTGKGGDGAENDIDSSTPGQGSSLLGSDSSIRDLTEAIQDAVADMLKDEDVAKDVQDVADALDSPLHEGASGVNETCHQVRPTQAQAVVAREVEDAMRDIVDAAEARHLKGVDHGKVNVRRYVTAQRFDADSMFDRFEPGQEDEVSIEVVILLDRSGSMDGGRLKAASAAVWAVQRAVESANGECTVLSYDTQHRIIQNKGDRAPNVIQQARAGGGTNPTTALVEAYRILRESEAGNRILLSVTDGDWTKGAATVEALNEHGVTTAMVLIDQYKFDKEILADEKGRERAALHIEHGRNAHQFVVGSAYGEEIADLFGDIASDLMGHALR